MASSDDDETYRCRDCSRVKVAERDARCFLCGERKEKALERAQRRTRTEVTVTREREAREKEKRSSDNKLAKLSSTLSRTRAQLEKERRKARGAEEETRALRNVLDSRQRGWRECKKRAMKERDNLSERFTAQSLALHNMARSAFTLSMASMEASKRKKKEHEEHMRTCPAAKNEAMLEMGDWTTFADVYMVAGKKTFPSHRAILASRSPVFASMLNLPMREAKERMICIPDMSAEGLKQFLFYLYTGRFRGGFDVKELGAEVLAAADKYDVKDMEETLRPLVEAQPGKDSSAVEGIAECVHGTAAVVQ